MIWNDTDSDAAEAAASRGQAAASAGVTPAGIVDGALGTARVVAGHWFGPAALGPLALAELAREREAGWRLPREIGVIAGSQPVGIGRAFSDLPQPNDGTVCVDEEAAIDAACVAK